VIDLKRTNYNRQRTVPVEARRKQREMRDNPVLLRKLYQIRLHFQLGRGLSAHNYTPRLLGGMVIAEGGRAKERMEGKDLAAAI